MTKSNEYNDSNDQQTKILVKGLTDCDWLTIIDFDLVLTKKDQHKFTFLVNCAQL